MDILALVQRTMNIKASIIASRILGVDRAAESMPAFAACQIELAAGRHGPASDGHNHDPDDTGVLILFVQAIGD
jgi:hypothetical protein